MTKQGIVVKGLSVAKGGKPVLKKLSFDVLPGRLVGLIGPSGAGKTTLMRTIIGVQIPGDGQVLVNGVLAGRAELRSTIGYVTQSPAVYGDLSVEQNLRYFGGLVGEDKNGVREVIESVDLTPQTRQVVETLSGGQKARVSLAVALLGDPSVLILDEPTVGLDPVLRRDLWAMFRDLAQQGKTIVISSHVMDEAELCDDILLMREGKMLWSKGKKELLSSTGTKTVQGAFLKLIGHDS